MKNIITLSIFCLITCGFVANVFAQSETPTCELTIRTVELDSRNDENDDKAEIKGKFSGFEFDLDVDDVTVAIGSSSKTIPAGSFEADTFGDGADFDDIIDDADVEMRIDENDDGSFQFKYEVNNVDLSETSFSLVIKLEIGNNSCEEEVRLLGELQFKGKEEIVIECEEGGNIIIDGCDTGVASSTPGIGDDDLCAEINECVNDTRNRDKFESCISDLTRILRNEDILSNDERNTIRDCASGDDGRHGKDDNDNGDDDDDDDDDNGRRN